MIRWLTEVIIFSRRLSFNAPLARLFSLANESLTKQEYARLLRRFIVRLVAVVLVAAVGSPATMAAEARPLVLFLGDSLTAADIYWAAMSQMLVPMPEDKNPITGPMREMYGGIGPVVGEATHPILLEHRDYIFEKHLSLPLDFMDTRGQ